MKSLEMSFFEFVYDIIVAIEARTKNVTIDLNGVRYDRCVHTSKMDAFRIFVSNSVPM